MTVNVSELIEKLKKLGYEIFINNGNIRCVFISNNKPRETEVLPLVDMIKSNKDAVIKYLQFLNETGLTARDYELDRYLGEPDLNPNKYPCGRCGAIAGRYCLGKDLSGKWWFGWWCLKCRPYNDPKLN